MTTGNGRTARSEHRGVRLDEVSVRFGRTVALHPLSLDIGRGEFRFLTGKNGSGKTTLLRVLSGVRKPSGGSRSGPARSAYVPAAAGPPPLAVSTWLRKMPSPHREDPSEALSLLDELGFDGNLSRSCRSLSFGNLRKLLLAEALTSGESLIVIDEATAGLDPVGTERLVDIVHRKVESGTTVVVADQLNRHALRVGPVLVLQRGRCVRNAAEADVETTVRLVGPSDRSQQLIDLAKTVGFRPMKREDS